MRYSYLGRPILFVCSWHADSDRSRGYFLQHEFDDRVWLRMQGDAEIMARVLLAYAEMMTEEMLEVGCPLESLQWEVRYPILFEGHPDLVLNPTVAVDG